MVRSGASCEGWSAPRAPWRVTVIGDERMRATRALARFAALVVMAAGSVRRAIRTSVSPAIDASAIARSEGVAANARPGRPGFTITVPSRCSSSDASTGASAAACRRDGHLEVPGEHQNRVDDVMAPEREQRTHAPHLHRLSHGCGRVDPDAEGRRHDARAAAVDADADRLVEAPAQLARQHVRRTRARETAEVDAGGRDAVRDVPGQPPRAGSEREPREHEERDRNQQRDASPACVACGRRRASARAHR